MSISHMTASHAPPLWVRSLGLRFRFPTNHPTNSLPSSAQGSCLPSFYIVSQTGGSERCIFQDSENCKYMHINTNQTILDLLKILPWKPPKVIHPKGPRSYRHRNLSFPNASDIIIISSSFQISHLDATSHHRTVIFVSLLWFPITLITMKSHRCLHLPICPPYSSEAFWTMRHARKAVQTLPVQ